MAISRSWKNAKRQLTLQAQYDSEARKENYEYGEMAADSAHERSIALYDYQKEAESLANQISEAKESGVNPAAIIQGYGGGSGGIGGGAQGGGARGVEGVDVAGILGAQNERKALSLEGIRVGAEVAKQRQEAKQTKAETERIKAETDKIKEETETENKSRDVVIENIKQEGWGKFLDNARKDWEGKEIDPRGEGSIYENTIYGDYAISNAPNFNKKEAAEIAELITRAELNTEKKKGYWEELLNATKNADANMIKANAIKLAAEWETGEFSNWKTWVETAGRASGTLKNLIGLGH